jgi:hypothetical protein
MGVDFGISRRASSALAGGTSTRTVGPEARLRRLAADRPANGVSTLLHPAIFTLQRQDEVLLAHPERIRAVQDGLESCSQSLSGVRTQSLPSLGDFDSLSNDARDMLEGWVDPHHRPAAHHATERTPVLRASKGGPRRMGDFG